MFLIQLKSYRPSSKVWVVEELASIIKSEDFNRELSHRCNEESYNKVIQSLKSISDIESINHFNDEFWDGLYQNYSSLDGPTTDVSGGIQIFNLEKEVIDNESIYNGDHVGL